MGWTNGFGENIVRIADSTGAAITAANPLSATLTQQLAGELQTTAPLGVASGRMVTSPATDETLFTLPTLNAKFIDTGTIQCYPGGRIKTIWIVITTALTWVTSGTPTIQLYSSRQAFVAAGGATTQLSLAQTYTTAAINALAGAGTTWTLNNVLRLTANTISSSVGGTNGVALAATNNPNSVTTPVSLVLNDPDTFIGVEFAFPSALTGGAMSVYLEQVSA